MKQYLNHFILILVVFMLVGSIALAQDNLYVSLDPANPTNAIYYPQVGMGTSPGVGDWNYSSPTVTVYIVPTGAQAFVAANFQISFDPNLASFVSANVTQGNLFAGSFFFKSYPAAGKIKIESSNLNHFINVAPVSGSYLAEVVFTILKPGYNPITLENIDFRYYDAINDVQQAVTITPAAGAVKLYLGDFATTGPPMVTTTGDGLINFDDLTPFSLAYWGQVGGTPPGYKAKFDIGPTNLSGSYFAFPTPDGVIEFEDLVIFSIGYGKSAAHLLPKLSTQPITLATLSPLAQADGLVRVPIQVSGVTDLRAISLKLSYSSSMTFVGVEKAGQLNTDYTFMKSKAEGGKVMVDAAVLGLEHNGISNDGVIAYVTFKGTGKVNVDQVRARNSANSPIGVTIQNSGTIPAAFALSQNYPNPFNPTTTISYQIPQDAQVSIVVYNMLGEQVSTLVNGMQNAGSYTATWNGKDGNGQSVTSGIYIYKMTAGNYVSTMKMVLMK